MADLADRSTLWDVVPRLPAGSWRQELRVHRLVVRTVIVGQDARLHAGPDRTPAPDDAADSGSDDLAEPDAHTESDPGDDRFADGCADCGADADRRFEQGRVALTH